MTDLPILRAFKDSWRQMPADCLLLGSGNGPEGELVRLVYRVERDGAHLCYIRSYTERRGHARSALAMLRERHGAVHIRHATSDGLPFHDHMLAQGVVESVRRD